MKWISVEKGLPDKEDVLAFVAKLGSHSHPDSKLGACILRREEINGYAGWYDPSSLDCFFDVEESVTHWMPLPSPPSD